MKTVTGSLFSGSWCLSLRLAAPSTAARLSTAILRASSENAAASFASKSETSSATFGFARTFGLIAAADPNAASLPNSRRDIRFSIPLYSALQKPFPAVPHEASLVICRCGAPALTISCHRSSAGQASEGVAAIVRYLGEKLPATKVLLLAVFPRAELATDVLRVAVGEINASISHLHDGERVHFLDIGRHFQWRDCSLRTNLMPGPPPPQPRRLRDMGEGDGADPFVTRYPANQGIHDIRGVVPIRAS